MLQGIMSARERKGLFRKKRDAESPGYKRKRELDEEKPSVVIRMIRRAWKRSVRASYFLADRWFDGIDFIRDIRSIADGAVHVICMTKNGNRKQQKSLAPRAPCAPCPVPSVFMLCGISVTPNSSSFR